MEDIQHQIEHKLETHIGSNLGVVPHRNTVPVVLSTADIAPSAINRGQMIIVRAVPGSTADILYVCLGDNGATTGYSWVQVATG
jgi:hypothetical protein